MPCFAIRNAASSHFCNDEILSHKVRKVKHFQCFEPLFRHIFFSTFPAFLSAGLPSVDLLKDLPSTSEMTAGPTPEAQTWSVAIGSGH